MRKIDKHCYEVSVASYNDAYYPVSCLYLQVLLGNIAACGAVGEGTQVLNIFGDGFI